MKNKKPAVVTLWPCLAAQTTVLLAEAISASGRRQSNIIALANNAGELTDFVALDNELALDNEGWALLSPRGEHKKERLANINGQMVREKYIQIVDDAAIDAVVANEKGTNIFSRIKRALVKRPIYRDHPDLKLYAPETVAAGNDQMIPLGVNDGCRKTERGLEFRPLLAPDGAVAVENDGCKYPSALFLLKKTGVVRDGGWVEVRPFALASIGLTAHPNISGVDSLANAKTNLPAEKTTDRPGAGGQPKTTDTMKHLLIGWLAANGVTLANDANDQIVWEKFLAEMTARAANVTSLGNSKQQLDVLMGDKTKLTQGATLPADLVTAANRILALENAQTSTADLKTKFIGARVDLAINQGKVAVADRDTEVAALENSKILDTDLEKLDKRPVKFGVASKVTGERKAGPDSAASAQKQVISLANSDPRYKDIADFATAYNKVLADHPQLAEALRQKESGENKSAATT